MREALAALKPQFQDQELAAMAAREYVAFLRQMREAPMLVPGLATDHVWHVHMLMPRWYAADCARIAGREVDHDDEADTHGVSFGAQL